MTRARTAVLVAAAIGAAAPADAQSSTCDLAAMATSVMNACCPGGGGHRRLQAQCDLPSECTSQACATDFNNFYEACQAELLNSPSLPFAQFTTFYRSCQAQFPAAAFALLSEDFENGLRCAIRRPAKKSNSDGRRLFF